MKKKDIIGIDNFIGSLKLNNFERETRSALASDHLMMYRIAKAFQDDVNELRKSYISGYEDRVEALKELRDRLAAGEEAVQGIINTDYADILTLEAELNAHMQDILEEEVELPLVKVPVDQFIDGLLECGAELSASDLIFFEPILK